MGITAALAAILGLDVGMFISWLIRKPAERAGILPPLFSHTWSMGHVWFISQAIILIMGVLGIAVALASPFKPGGNSLMTVAILSLIPQNLLLFGLPAAYIVKVYGIPLRDIGLPMFPDVKIVRTGIRWGVLMLIVALVFQAAAESLIKITLGANALGGLERATQEFGNEQFIKQSLHNPWNTILLLITGGLFAPFGEEFFFRGFLFNAAKRRMGLWPGIMLSAAIFALIHGGPLLILAIFPVGIILALAYEKTGSLWVPIFMHITFNSMQLIAGLWIKY